jgi:hypothetical protein
MDTHGFAGPRRALGLHGHDAAYLVPRVLDHVRDKLVEESL